MEKSKAFELASKWPGLQIIEFIEWLYEKGFTIETRFQGEDLKKQKELLK